MESNTEDAIQDLTNDTKHVLLKEIQNEPQPPGSLADILGVDRSTVHRNATDLKDRGWIEQRNGNYHLTTGGEVVVPKFEELGFAITAVNKTQEFLEEFPEPLPAEALAEASTTTGARPEPHAPLIRFTNSLDRDISHIRCLVPIFSEIFNDAIWPLIQDGTRVEGVVTPELLETARGKDDLGNAIDATSYEMYLLPDDIEFGLAIFDNETVHAGAFAADGTLTAGLLGDSDALLDWANDRFDTYKQRSQPLTEYLTSRDEERAGEESVT